MAATIELTEKTNRTQRAQQLAATCLGVALVVPLVVYAWVGSYARYTADDYCWAGVLRQEGFLRAQAWWYVGYSPRYAFTFIVNAVELLGAGIVPLLPSLAIVAWVGALTWALCQLRLARSVAVLLALLVPLATIQTAPDIEQSLFWQTGMLTYVLPLVLATILIGLIARALRRPRVDWGTGLLCCGITFAAGGLSETYLIPQNVALTFALVVSLVAARGGTPGGRNAALLSAAALAGGVLALVAIVVAPATAYRVGGAPADPWLASSAAIATGAYQALRLVRYFAPTLALCVLLPGLLGSTEAAQSRDLKRLVGVTALTAIVVPFCYFPSFYASNGNPPARSLIVPGSLLIAYAVYAGYALRGWLRVPRAATAALLLVLALVPLGIAATAFPERATAAEYAMLWDTEDTQIRAARDSGARRVEVPPLPRNLGESFITPDPGNWFNVCVARYYGLETIASTGELP